MRLVSASLLILLLPLAQDPAPQTFPPSTVALAAGLQYASATVVKAPHNFLRDIPLRAADGLVSAVVEIPAGTCEKWEIGLDGVMHWDLKDGVPRHVKYLPYPCNYGILPQAVLGKELGGDGDPLDALVLGPALPRGTVVAVRAIGVIRLVDAGDKDDKLLLVDAKGPFGAVNDVAQLDEKFPGVTLMLRTFFVNYKGKDALQCSGFDGAAAARELIEIGHKSFLAQPAAK